MIRKLHLLATKGSDPDRYAVTSMNRTTLVLQTRTVYLLLTDKTAG